MQLTVILEQRAQAERHIIEGAQEMAQQKETVERLRRGGHDTQSAQELLRTLEEIQVMHLLDLDRLRAELKASD